MVGMMACSRLTSLPSEAPKPPGSMKSRCMSMTTSAMRGAVEGKVEGARADHGHQACPAM